MWHELVEMSKNVRVMGQLWYVLEDFNQTLHPAKHSKSQIMNVDRKMRDFRECLCEAEPEDLTYKGSTFTWWNKSSSNPTAKN